MTQDRSTPADVVAIRFCGPRLLAWGIGLIGLVVFLANLGPFGGGN